MSTPLDFLMIYPHAYGQGAYSQRLLLAVLQKAGYSVRLLVVGNAVWLQKSEKLRNEFLELVQGCKCVGFGFMSEAYQSVQFLTRLIKSHMEKHVIYGGPHATTSYMKMVGQADAIFVGESEKTLPAYVSALLDKRRTDHIPQIVTNAPDFRQGATDDILMNLDELPIPLYSPKYHSELMEDHIETTPEFYRNAYKHLQLMGSRGCPYSCTYCANSYIKKCLPEGTPYIRKRSVDHIMAELRYACEELPIETVAIEDDQFLVRDAKELEEFVEKYNQQVWLPINITGLSPAYLSPDKLAILQGLPLSDIRIGIQTVSQNGLDVYRRRFANRNIDELSKTIAGLSRSLSIRYDIILDNPYETVQDYVQTLCFLSSLPKPFSLILYHLTFFEGTELRDKAIADGKIEPTNMKHTERSYVDLDDNYVNTLFQLLTTVKGHIPEPIMRLLTSSLFLRTAILQKMVRLVWATIAGKR